jgi:hypothetical protein
MDPETRRILDLLKTSMRILGHTNRDIERPMGWSSSYLSRLFSGAIELKFEHILDICRQMGLDPGEFLRMAFPVPVGRPASEAAERLRESIRGFAPVESPAPEPPKVSDEEVEKMLAKALRQLLTRAATE